MTQWYVDRGDETLRLDYPLTPESIVFDLGGYKGDFAADIYEKHKCNVYVFEPVQRFYSACIDRFRGNEKIKCFNYGLSNENGSFLISDEDNGSSIIKNNASGSCERVFVKSFDEEMKALGVPHIDLLKINVEGAEFLILPHILAKNLMPKIRYLQVQFHTFYPQAKTLRDNIRRQLSDTHDEQWNYTFAWESWARRQ
jgi:FkbM family methyltransferase